MSGRKQDGCCRVSHQDWHERGFVVAEKPSSRQRQIVSRRSILPTKEHAHILGGVVSPRPPHGRIDSGDALVQSAIKHDAS